MSKDEKCTCKACKNIVLDCQICKFEGFLLPSSSWLLKLPTGNGKSTSCLVADKQESCLVIFVSSTVKVNSALFLNLQRVFTSVQFQFASVSSVTSRRDSRADKTQRQNMMFIKVSIFTRYSLNITVSKYQKFELEETRKLVRKCNFKLHMPFKCELFANVCQMFHLALPLQWRFY